MRVTQDWNIFRYLADLSHLVSVGILLHKMIRKRSCSGVSLRTQILYLVVFCTRYLNENLFSPPLWNVCFKFFYIGSAVLVVVLMLTKLKATWEARHDNFRVTILLVLCLIPGYFMRPRPGMLRFFYSYSLWLEVVAIFPQLILLGRSRRLDVLTREYIFFMSIYRLFYLLNWVQRWITKVGYTPRVLWVTGICQTLVYIDFIYVYLKMKITGAEFELPYGERPTFPSS
jgi:ER lumen protein retaining receptor